MKEGRRESAFKERRAGRFCKGVFFPDFDGCVSVILQEIKSGSKAMIVIGNHS